MYGCRSPSDPRVVSTIRRPGRAPEGPVGSGIGRPPWWGNAAIVIVGAGVPRDGILPAARNCDFREDEAHNPAACSMISRCRRTPAAATVFGHSKVTLGGRVR